MSAGGETTVRAVECAGLDLSESLLSSVNAACYSVETEASFEGPATICIEYDDSGLSADAEASLLLVSRASAADPWRTLEALQRDLARDRICGETEHFSVFTVAFPAAPILPGDCNRDGGVDVSDGICLLGFLFQGSPGALPCGDGSARDPGNLGLVDWNGDATVDLSDPVSLLGWAFLGGAAHILGGACQPLPSCPVACES